MPAVLCRAAVACLATVIALGPAGVAAGQASVDFPYLAALTADDVVRSGPDARYYPFAKVSTGDVVRVVGEKAGWARVATAGPAFRLTFGFIKHSRTGTGRVRLDPGGRTGTTTAKTDVFAPNLDSDSDPTSSWKPAVSLPAGREVRIVETISTTDEVIYRIVIPADAEGWIDPKHLRRATPSEAAAFQAALSEKAPIPTVPATSLDVPRQAPASSSDVVPVTKQPPVGRAKLNQGATIQPPVGEHTPTTAPPNALVHAGPVAIDPASTAGAPPGETAPPVSDALPAAPRPRPVPRPIPPEQRRAKIMLQDLEVAYTRLLQEPIETAEVGPLRLLYIDLADRHKDSRAIARFARTRASQLELWSEVQERRAEMTEAVEKARQTTKSAEASRQVIASFDRYAAVGRLDASTIYDGKRLPKLLRVQDTTSGRTLLYIEPDDRFDYANLLGQRVGIVGESMKDDGLRVTLINPRRIDVLNAKGDVVTPAIPPASPG